MARQMSSRGDIFEQFEVDRMDEAPPEGPSAADQIGGLKDLCSIAIFAVTYLAFPSTSLVIFRTFDQDENISDAPGEKDLSYLKADMSIDCTTGAYWWWSYYATAMVFVYPLGIPAIYGYQLYAVSGRPVRRTVLECQATTMVGSDTRPRPATQVRQSWRIFVGNYSPGRIRH